MGKNKNTGANYGFVLGFFLGVIGLVILLYSENTAEVTNRKMMMNARVQYRQQQTGNTTTHDSHQTPPPPPSMLTDNNLHRLMKLAELKERGHITQEEFDIQKSKLL